MSIFVYRVSPASARLKALYNPFSKIVFLLAHLSLEKLKKKSQN